MRHNRGMARLIKRLAIALLAAGAASVAAYGIVFRLASRQLERAELKLNRLGIPLLVEL